MQQESFPTYGALARSAMIFGVPIVPLFFMVLIFAFLLLMTLPILGIKAFLFPALAVPIIVFMKQISKNDDKALEMIGYEIYCFTFRRNTKFFNNATTILGTTYKEDKDAYNRFFKTTPTQAGFAGRFSTQNIPTRHT